MALSAAAQEYFSTMSPLATKIHEDIVEAKNSYESIWDTLTDKEKDEIINESIIKPEIALKYALLDNLDFDLNDPPVRKDDLMSFFGRDHAQRMVQDENSKWRDEHSGPFLYQTRSQLNLCVLSEHREQKDKTDDKTTSPQPVLTELAMSHSKVVSELKNALKSHDVLKSAYKDKQEPVKRELVQPQGFISKFLTDNFKSKDDDKERLVSAPQSHIVASSDNFFRTNFKSPPTEMKFEKDYRSSIAKSSSDLSEENRGLLSSASQASSGDFQSCEELHTSPSDDTLAGDVPHTGFDFLDNW